MLDRIKLWLNASGGPARIILAEDDPDLRNVIEATLREDGHDVLPFRDGRHLLAYIEALVMMDKPTEPDLLISDVMMPGYTGLEILAALRETELEMPVILISAFGDRAMHAQAFDLGAAMIDKPFDIDTLLNTVRLLVR
jgi:DNA-binding response OmpR family regulator